MDDDVDVDFDAFLAGSCPKKTYILSVYFKKG